MSEYVDSSQLVGHNRMELLLFRLRGKQRFGINVFKVQEVIKCPHLTCIPHSHPVVMGVATIRGQTIPVMDLGMAVGEKPLETSEEKFVIIAEYNKSVHGFLVNGVDRIVNMNWEDVHTPPEKTTNNSYVTAVTQVDEEIIEILDVEKVLSEVVGFETEISEEILNHGMLSSDKFVLIVDDSSVARKQTTQILNNLGLNCLEARDGKEGLRVLSEMADRGPIEDQIALVISDLEMPEMDGYTFAKQIRGDSALSGLYVVLHTSLSGVFNEDLVKSVGADKFIPKFSPDHMAREVIDFFEREKRNAA